MNKAPLKLTLAWLIPVVIIYAILFNWLDMPLMYFISHDYQGTSLFSASKTLKMIFSPLIWFIVGIACLGYSWWSHKKHPLPYTPYTLAIGINLIFAFILAFIVKYCLARYRPSNLLDNNLYGFHYFSLLGGSGSTPSGHTVMAFTLFITIARFVKKSWFTLLCLLPPIIVGISRLILADHYVSDIILSAYIGTISVFWGEWMLQRFFSAWTKPKAHAE